MNSRQTGAAASLVSSDISEINEEMVSRRVVSEDQAHFILIKGSGLSSREDSQESQIESESEQAAESLEQEEPVDDIVVMRSEEDSGLDLANSGVKRHLDFQTENKGVRRLTMPSLQDTLFQPHEEARDDCSSELHDIDTERIRENSATLTSHAQIQSSWQAKPAERMEDCRTDDISVTSADDQSTAAAGNSSLGCYQSDIQTSSDEFVDVPSDSDGDMVDKAQTVIACDLFPQSVFERVADADAVNTSDVQAESVGSKSGTERLSESQSSSNVLALGSKLSGDSIAGRDDAQSSSNRQENQDNSRADYLFVGAEQDAADEVGASSRCTY